MTIPIEKAEGEYGVQLEIAGPAAMWTRPDTGICPISYPAPTYSAVKAIFESVLYSHWATVVPVMAEICKPVVYVGYTTNYGGPLRKGRTIAKGSSYQLKATILADVCYKLYAKVISRPQGYITGSFGDGRPRTTKGSHAYAEMFVRRLERGACNHMPFLGWKEFTPSYFGFARSNTCCCEDINIVIPSMLHSCFLDRDARNADRLNVPEWRPVYKQDVEIREGRIRYVE